MKLAYRLLDASGMRKLVCLLPLLWSTSAWAISRHEKNIKVESVKESGKVVGFKIKVILQSSNFDVATVGIGRTSVREDIKKTGWNPTAMRALVEKEDPKYVRLKFPAQKGLGDQIPREVQYEVRYGVNNDLTPGEEVDVYSAWRGANDTKNQHFYGVFTGGGHESTSIKLPTE